MAARVAAYQGRKVIVGIRPEDLIVSSGPGLVTETRLVEVLGSEQHVYFWLDATPAAQAAAAAAAADDAAEAGFLVGSAPNGMARIDPHTRSSPAGASPSPSTRRACTSSTRTRARRLPAD